MDTKIFIFLILAIDFSSATVSIDCHPDSGSTQERCNSRGCIWAPKSTPGAPWCEFTSDLSTMAGYEASGTVKKSTDNSDILTAKLRRRSTPTLFGDDFERAIVKIDRVTEEILRISITDQHQIARPAYLPNWKQNLHESGAELFSNSRSSRNAVFEVQVENSPFGFAVVRQSSGTPLIDTRRLPGLTFAQQYLQISFKTPTRFVYGLGDTTHSNFTHDFNYRKWGLFNYDHPPGYDDAGLYGFHPFYLCIDDDHGNTHGVFFQNTHALNVALQPDPDNPNGGIITWRSIGGIFDFFVFSGPTTDDVVRQYTSVIGRPQFPPYWSLGYQLCRYGYTNLTFLDMIFTRNREALIPQDVQFIDIDYMYEYMDFTFDPVAFANLSQFIEKLHNQSMKLVLIVDPGIASRPPITYYPLIRGLEAAIFITDNRTAAPIEGKVWPGFTYFPDFTHPDATTWWTAAISDFYQNFWGNESTKFDGLWIDMNEPSNFLTGSVNKCQSNKLTKPPYNPLIYADINDKTLCMDAVQFAGRHYELHNVYGFTESKSTYDALQSVFPGKRPFILSRSTYAGSGRYANHWTGDNRSLWSHMKMSIVAMLEFNLFGIPMVGADICGFANDASEELCVRWHQLGAFYPYSRNHNAIESEVEQDPAAWSKAAVDIIRTALSLRYGFLPYLYTLLYQSHLSGAPVARSLFSDYASDKTTRNIDDQFLWGSGLMIAPVITQGTISRPVYFPSGRWFDALKYKEVPSPSAGRWLNVDMPLDSIGLYFRGGAIVPWQDPAVTTALSRQNNFTLLVALDQDSKASGSLYWDDGDTVCGNYSLVQFEAWKDAARGGVHVKVISYHYPIQPWLNSISIYGMESAPQNVALDGVAMPPEKVFYDPATKSLSLSHQMITLDKAHEISWQSQFFAM